MNAPYKRSDMLSDEKVICRGLWKVFGDEKRTAELAKSGLSAIGPDEFKQLDLIPAVCGVSFAVKTGEIFVIMGLSGSGKSTVIRCLSRLIEPTAGEVIFDGRDLLKMAAQELTDMRRHRFGMVFQSFGLLPHLSALENVAFPLLVQGVSKQERTTRAIECLELVGLTGREGSYPNELSGGQQQRVGIARSLAVQPELWFLDEPFSALDPLIRRQMQDEFVDLQRRLHKTIIFVTHDFLEAVRIADRVAIMKDGRIEQIGTPAEIVLRPATVYIAEFTKDVPLSKILTARDVMASTAVEITPTNSVSSDTGLDVLMRLFAAGVEAVEVIDPMHGRLGIATSQTIFQGLTANQILKGPGGNC